MDKARAELDKARADKFKEGELNRRKELIELLKNPNPKIVKAAEVNHVRFVFLTIRKNLKS